ncbi:MAG: IS110 family transposase [Alphaproteobacteria bacterium]|nr:IS110 family transposase [Alphaproteobacteria bacterium]
MSPHTRHEAAAPTGAEITTLYVAIEISRKSWVVGIKSPLGEKIGLHTLGAADVASLRGLLEQHRVRAERTLGQAVAVRVCYEAGYEGFWLARWLERMMGLDPVVLSRVRVPSVEEEDRKRLLRERQRLVKERTALTNAIKGLLKLHGIFDLEPRTSVFNVTFAAVTTAYGEPFPPRARREIERLAERLGLVLRQIEAIEAERDAAIGRAGAVAGSGTGADASIATLSRLKGIGTNDATLLTHEVFYREFRNRRELADWAGLTPTPWASGDVQRDQGIGRDGPAWIRAQLVQMAWRWVRFQPDSALTQWFEARTAGARGRTRRVMIVALARKLLIALWRYAATGLVPTGARVT